MANTLAAAEKGKGVFDNAAYAGIPGSPSSGPESYFHPVDVQKSYVRMTFPHPHSSSSSSSSPRPLQFHTQFFAVLVLAVISILILILTLVIFVFFPIFIFITFRPSW